MEFQLTDDQLTIRQAIRDICRDFPGQYWRDLEASGEYPAEFVATMTKLGWLATLIPEQYGGGGLGVTEAGIILEEIHRSGGHAGACHAQMYTMGTVLRHGTEEQKRRYLPEIAAGRLRLQAFGVTEPGAGSDTTKITTRAVRDGDHFTITGQKVFTSRIAYSDLMLLLARTTPVAEVTRRTDGLSVFLVDLREAGDSVQWQRIPVISAHHTYQVFIDNLRVPAENLIGPPDRGFHCILDGMNAERVLVASEAVGDGRFLIERAVTYASTREVFGRPLGANQGVQFPLAQAHVQLEAAALMRFHAANLFDRGRPCGAEANAAKLLASQASWAAANAAMTAYGGNGFAVEYDIERKFRETKLLEIVPISNNLVLSHLAHHVLGLPRSY
jgi:acyl-CoA dehydrogenase